MPPSRAKTAALTALLLLTKNLMPCSGQCIHGGNNFEIGEVAVREIVSCNQDGTYLVSTRRCTENDIDEAQVEEENCPDEQICVTSEEGLPACENADEASENADEAKGDKDDKKGDKKKKEETPDDVDQKKNDELEGEEKPDDEEESPVEDEAPMDPEPDVETEANEEQKDEEQATNKQEEDIDMANDSKNEPEAEDRDEETQEIVEEEPDGEELPDEDEPPTEANQEQEDEEQNADEQEEDTNLANESNKPNEKDEEAEDGDEDGGEYEDADEEAEEYEEEADEGDKDGDEDENEEEAQDGDEEGVSDEGCVVGESMLEYGRSTGPIMVGCANETWYETIETICEDDGAVTELLSESACPEMQECFPCGSVALCMSNLSDLPEECRTDIEDVSMVPDGAFDMDATRDSIRAAAESMSDAYSKRIGSLTITLGVISVASVHLWY